MAIIPFENQSASREIDWAGLAIAQLTASAAVGGKSLHVFVAADTNEAFRGRASRIVTGSISGTGNTLTLSGVIQDGRVRTVAPLSLSGDALTITRQLARQLQPDSRELTAKSSEAVQLFGQAQTAASPQQAAAMLEQCVARDPGFVEGQLALARLRGAPPSLPGGAKLDPIDSARVQLAQARTDADRIGAAERLAGVLPADPEPAAAAGMIFLRERQYERSMVWLRKATLVDPDAAEHWNTLSYVQAYAGNLSEAVASNAEYAKRISGGNASDSLGEIYFMHGKFAEAEKAFLEAYQKQPDLLGYATLRKAALARRSAGDAKGADAIFQRYLDAQSQNPLREVFAAQWEYSAGNAPQAISRLEKFAREKNASAAWSQLAVWRRIGGGSGTEEAKKSLETAAAGRDRLSAALAYFVTMSPAAPAEWRSRAERTFPQGTDPQMRTGVLAYGLLMDRHFADAVPPLTALWKGGPVIGANEWAVPLAWALAQTGKPGEARDLLKYWPIPDSLAESIFSAWMTAKVPQLRKL
ncbi:MAG: hypothetical protein U0Q16_32425 [Bryobacteraceae bacterium]